MEINIVTETDADAIVVLVRKQFIYIAVIE